MERRALGVITRVDLRASIEKERRYIAVWRLAQERRTPPRKGFDCFRVGISALFDEPLDYREPCVLERKLQRSEHRASMTKSRRAPMQPLVEIVARREAAGSAAVRSPRCVPMFHRAQECLLSFLGFVHAHWGAHR